MNKKKINRKTAKYRKNGAGEHYSNKKKLGEDVNGWISSALARYEVDDGQNQENECADVVLNRKKKRNQRSQKTKNKKISLKKSHRRKNKEFVPTMEKSEKHVRKYVHPVDPETYEKNFKTLVNSCSDDALIESSTNMTQSFFYICQNDVSPQENLYIAESDEKHDNAVTMHKETKEKCEFDKENNIIQAIEHRVLDRLLISVLGNNNKYNDQSVNKEKIEEKEMLSPANKFNEDHQTEKSETISKTTSVVHVNKISPKVRRRLVSSSDTKVKKATSKNKKKRVKSNTLKKRKEFCRSDYEISVDHKQMEIDRLIISALNDEVVEHSSDEYNYNDYKVDDANVDSNNVDYNFNDAKEVTNLLLKNLSPYMESIAYPNFIYDKLTNDTDTKTDPKGKVDKKYTQKCDSVIDWRQVESMKATEKGICS